MTQPKKKAFVLVLMPFSEQFLDIYEYGIKQACEAAGADCERIDEQVFTGDILNRLFRQIETADLIVAEVTGKNQNVYYEVGYAHASKKQVVLLTQTKDDIPFDLKHFPHIAYDSLRTLNRDLLARVRALIENPEPVDVPEGGGIPTMIGTWKSSWVVEENGQAVEKTETFHIRRQRGNRFFGDVVWSEARLGEQACKLDGEVNDRFLQIRWTPGDQEISRGLIDYGCYFLERQPDGSYKGPASGFLAAAGAIVTYQHVVTRSE